MLDTTISDQTQAFLDAFGDALASGDIAAACDMFEDDCYWRDLVSFAWNIKTVEGKEQVADMLKHQLATTRPSNWRLAEGEIPAEEGGPLSQNGGPPLAVGSWERRSGGSKNNDRQSSSGSIFSS